MESIKSFNKLILLNHEGFLVVPFFLYYLTPFFEYTLDFIFSFLNLLCNSRLSASILSGLNSLQSLNIENHTLIRAEENQL